MYNPSCYFQPLSALMQCAAEHPPEPGRDIQENHGMAMSVFPCGSEALEQDYPGALVPSGSAVWC